MKFYKLLAAGLTAGMLLAGCSNGGQTASSQSVSHKCTASFSGMDVTLNFTAPSEKDAVTEMVMSLNLPASFFQMSDLSAVTQEMMDALKPSLAEQLGIPAENITVKSGKEAIEVSIKFDKDQMVKALQLKDSANLEMASLLKELQTDDFAKCD
ncbi:MAG: hypothetical protein HUJ54_14015 [Erysipelotrichaceae bacterium]|nr:hypothetical protein [Erysipelotrichaceae bacterium]